MTLFVVFITTVVYVFCKGLGYNVSFVIFAFILAIIMSIGSFFFSDKLVLATSGAKPVTKDQFPKFYRVVENLSIGDGLPMPKVYVIDDPSPNAFSTGRDPKHAVVCATTGILDMCTEAELEGVIAHELSHVKDYDIRLMAVVAVLVGFVALIANIFMRSLWFRNDDDNNNSAGQIFLIVGIVFAILSPIIATLIQLAVSRKREYLADAAGALLTRYPEGLASALEKISAYDKPMKGANNGTAHLFIINPFSGKSAKSWFAGLFDTHPPIEERIKILRAM